MTELGPVTNATAARAEAGVGAVRKQDDPAKVKEAATQFEALLITQMLKSMRAASSEGWLGTGDDQAGMTMMELGEESMAQMMAQQGGLGLASMVVRGLNSATSGAAPDVAGAKR
jgi:peptidoglycan hydrolase FlgJ